MRFFAPMVLVSTSVVLSCGVGCCLQRRPEVPFGSTAEGRGVLSRGVDPARARDILAQAPPRQVMELRQLMFIADLQMAEGNENNPARLLHRVQRELAEPLVVPHNDVQVVIDDISRVVQSLPQGQDGAVIVDSSEGYATVGRALTSASGLFPTTGDCLQRLMDYPADLAVAFLSREYVADHHYHDHNMRVAILRALTTSGVGAQALPIFRQAILDERDSTYSTIFRSAVDGARQILGPSFEAWYWEVQGRSICRDQR